ncbi:MAG: FtsX-like permease family protein [Candidatus Odinarchaeota archaeon]
MAELSEREQAIIFSQDLRSKILGQAATAADTINNHKIGLDTYMSRVIATFPIDQATEKRLAYTYCSFSSNNSVIYHLLGFFNGNVSYFNPFLKEGNLDFSGEEFRAYLFQQYPQPSFEIGECVIFASNGETTGISVQILDIIRMEEDLTAFFDLPSRENNEAILVLPMSELLPLLDELFENSSLSFNKITLYVIQTFDYSKLGLFTSSELSDLSLDISGYINDRYVLDLVVEGEIFTGFVGAHYLHVIQQFFLLLLIPITILSIYFIFYLDRIFIPDFFRFFKSLRMKGFRLKESIIFITVNDLLITLIGSFCGTIAGFSLLSALTGVIFSTNDYLLFFLGFLGTFVFLSVLVVYSDLKNLQLLVRNEYMDHSSTHKNRENYLAKNRLDIAIWIFGLILFGIFQGLQPFYYAASDPALLPVLRLIMTVQTLSFCLLLLGSFLIIARSFFFYLIIIKKILLRFEAKIAGMAAKYASRNYLSTRMTLLVLVTGLFFAMFTSSVGTVTMTTLQEKMHYNTGSDIVVYDYLFNRSDDLNQYCTTKDIEITSVMKVSNADRIFLGIDPENYLAAAYHGKKSWYSDKLADIVGQLHRNNTILIGKYAKNELKVEIDHFIGIPEIYDRSQASDGVFQVKGVFTFWPNLVVEKDESIDTFFDQQNQETAFSQYYYVINLDKLKDLVEKEWLLSGEVDYYHYIRIENSQQISDIRQYLAEQGYEYEDVLKKIDRILSNLPWSVFFMIIDFYTLNSWVILTIVVSFFAIFLFRERNKQFAIYRAVGIKLSNLSHVYLFEALILYSGVILTVIFLLLPLLYSFGNIFQVFSPIPPPIIFPPLELLLIFAVLFLIECAIISWILSRLVPRVTITSLLKVE